MFRKEVIFKTIRGYPRSHASTIVQANNGDILVAWYAGDYEGAANQAIFLSRLTDGKWSPPLKVVDTPGKPDGNPVLFKKKTGEIYLYYVVMHGRGWETCDIRYVMSNDQGFSWSPMKIFHKELGWMIRNEPIYLSTGEIIFPIYDERDWSSIFLVSKDEERTWIQSNKLISRPGNIQPAVVELSDRSLLAFMRTSGKGGYIWYSRSFNHGLTWTNPKHTNFKNPNSAIDLIKLSNGSLLLAFNDSFNSRTPLSLILSEDEGETWKYYKVIEKREGEYSYPSLLEDKDGLIHLVYTNNRKNIAHVVFNLDWLMN